MKPKKTIKQGIAVKDLKTGNYLFNNYTPLLVVKYTLDEVVERIDKIDKQISRILGLIEETVKYLKEK